MSLSIVSFVVRLAPVVRFVPVLGLVLAGACSGRAVVTPAPTPASMPVTVNPPVTVTAPAPSAQTQAAKPKTDFARPDWHRMDLERDGVLGVGSDRALQELLANRSPARKVIVAVIDGGVDTAHTLLASNMWRNPREVAGNGKDDDGNGFVDDVFGWNVATDRSGASFQFDTFELTRLYAACKGLAAGTGIARPDQSTCTAVAQDYRAKVQEIKQTRDQISGISGMLEQVTAALKSAMAPKPITRATVTAFAPTSSSLTQAKQLWLELDGQGLSAEEITKANAAYAGQYRYGLDTMYAPRTAGTVPSTGASNGNRDVTGPDASHGTHVAGIIGATRTVGQEVQGIAPSVAIMSVRAVPDGDERDPDVARAIRYAVDNGAQIINMSFGKDYSPNKSDVDAAVAYAESKGVLLVHAAGNDGKSLETAPSFPSAKLQSGSTASNWLEIGASSWKGMTSLAAEFSNYGKTRVDIFAPGVDILSTLPGGETGRESGTSMAAPVVSGVAALLMSYFPELTAVDVKRILLESVRKLPDVDVAKPGDGDARVKFGSLSRTGGVVDAYAAVKLALARRAVTP
jgi:subtilisin family serine protease